MASKRNRRRTLTRAQRLDERSQREALAFARGQRTHAPKPRQGENAPPRSR